MPWAASQARGGCGFAFGGKVEVHTTHLVFAGIMALVAANAQRRRCLGSDCIHALKARLLVLLGARILVIVGACRARAAGKGIADRHWCLSRWRATRRQTVVVVMVGCGRMT